MSPATGADQPHRLRRWSRLLSLGCPGRGHARSLWWVTRGPARYRQL